MFINSYEIELKCSMGPENPMDKIHEQRVWESCQRKFERSGKSRLRNLFYVMMNFGRSRS